jgi:palmitoyltransferase ZDHHC3/7/25
MCADEDCAFNVFLLQLVRLVTILSLGALLFTSSMIMNVTFGLMTGIGTIDRLKKKASDTIQDAVEQPIPLKDVFGIGAYWEWIFPIDPVFDNYDRVLGFSTPQRLLREEMNGDPMKMNSPSGVSKDMLSI